MCVHMYVCICVCICIYMRYFRLATDIKKDFFLFHNKKYQKKNIPNITLFFSRVYQALLYALCSHHNS